MDRDLQFLRTAGEALNAAADGLREDNDRAERKSTLPWPRADHCADHGCPCADGCAGQSCYLLECER